jgi:hypothetical protein
MFIWLYTVKRNEIEPFDSECMETKMPENNFPAFFISSKIYLLAKRIQTLNQFNFISR